MLTVVLSQPMRMFQTDFFFHLPKTNKHPNKLIHVSSLFFLAVGRFGYFGLFLSLLKCQRVFSGDNPLEQEFHFR